jgi:hypothetical protein
MMKKILAGMLAVVMLLTGAPLAAAAAAGTKIDGIALYDSENGSPIPGAAMQLRNVDTGAVVQTTIANGQGAFSFNDVPDGRYIVEIVSGDKVVGASEALTIKSDGLAGLKVIWKEGKKAGAFFTSTAGILLLGAAAVGATVGIVAATKDDASGSK